MGVARAAHRTRRGLRGGSLILATLAFAAPAQAAPELVKVGDFAEPTYVTGPPGDGSRLFVTERAGRVRVVRDGAVLAAPFLDLSGITQTDHSERGLLSMAFAPDYAASGRFYVALTARPAGAVEVREYRRSARDPDVGDAATARVLLTIPHDQAPNHNGGQLQFGPDGTLWLSTGDGGGGDDGFHHAQDPASLLGKLIRFDPAAPAPEVVARGLRNPWRFSFDRATGQIVIADVGQNQYEEVDVGLAANYGWPCREGAHAYLSDLGCDGVATHEPVLEKSHAGDGSCSITGGYVVRDPGLPTLVGRYVYGDFCAPALRSFDVANGGTDAPIGLSVAQLSSFGEDACGRLLVVSLAGSVHRLVDGAPSSCPSAPTVPPPVAVATETRPCVLAARVTGLRSVRRRHRLTVALRTDEVCRATVSARIRGVARFTGARRSLVAGRRHVVRLRLSSGGVRAVRRALRRHGSLRVAVRVRAVDAAGNVGTLARGVRIRR